MSDLYPNDPHQYFEKFKLLWNYVQAYLIDQEHGDWYQGGIDKEPNMKTALKGQIWKGTYHNLRSLMNCVQRLDPDAKAPSVPANIKLKTINHTPQLSWNASNDNRNLLGYNIYINNRRVGYTPLTHFSLEDLKKFKGGKVSVKAIDLQGNESAFSKPVSY